jgi:hypothetical protein
MPRAIGKTISGAHILLAAPQNADFPTSNNASRRSEASGGFVISPINRLRHPLLQPSGTTITIATTTTTIVTARAREPPKPRLSGRLPMFDVGQFIWFRSHLVWGTITAAHRALTQGGRIGQGPVKWFNPRKGYGFILLEMVARMYSCTFQRWSVRICKR